MSMFTPRQRVKAQIPTAGRSHRGGHRWRTRRRLRLALARQVARRRR